MQCPAATCVIRINMLRCAARQTHVMQIEFTQVVGCVFVQYGVSCFLVQLGPVWYLDESIIIRGRHVLFFRVENVFD